MQKKNIILFLNAFWNNGNGTTGGDQMLKQIFKRIRNDFQHVDCYTSFDGKNFLIDINQIKFKIAPSIFEKLPISVIYVIRTIFAFNVLTKKNIDIIYAGSDFFPDVIPCFAYKTLNPKTKWIQSIFHIYPSYKNRKGNKITNFLAEYLQKFSFYLIRSKADKIININSEVKNYLITKGFDPLKIEINPPGIDVEYLDNLKIGAKTPKYNGVFLGRLNKSKGIFDLIEICNLIKQKYPKYKLAIIGSGSESVKKELTKKIKEKGLSHNISLLGYLEDEKAFKIIKNADMFIFPSYEEGFGIVIAESIACGIPVLAWNLSVYDEVFENNIFKFERGDLESLSSKAIDILKNGDKYKIHIAKSRIFIQKYDWNKVAKRVLEIMNS